MLAGRSSSRVTLTLTLQSLRAALKSAEERIVQLNFAEEKAQRKLSEGRRACVHIVGVCAASTLSTAPYDIGMRKVMQERKAEAEARAQQKQKTGQETNAVATSVLVPHHTALAGAVIQQFVTLAQSMTTPGAPEVCERAFWLNFLPV